MYCNAEGEHDGWRFAVAPPDADGVERQMGLRLCLISRGGHCLGESKPIEFDYRCELIIVNRIGLRWFGLDEPPWRIVILDDENRPLYGRRILCADERVPFRGIIFIERGLLEIPVVQPGNPGDRYEWVPVRERQGSGNREQGNGKPTHG